MKKAWISFLTIHVLAHLFNLLSKHMIKIGKASVAVSLSDVAVWLAFISIVLYIWYLIKRYQ